MCIHLRGRSRERVLAGTPHNRHKSARLDAQKGYAGMPTIRNARSLSFLFHSPRAMGTWSEIRTPQIAPTRNRQYDRRQILHSSWYIVSLLALRSRLSVLGMLLALVFSGAARAETSDVETAWRLLDYIAVDYAGAVSHGAVTSSPEYAEQNEFAATVTAKLAALPPKPER